MVAEPEASIGGFFDREEKIHFPGLFAQIQRPKFRDTEGFTRFRDAEAIDAFSNRCRPQNAFGIFVKRMHILQPIPVGQRNDPSGGIRIIADTAVGGDPQHVPATAGKGIDGIVLQLRICRRIAGRIFPGVGLAVVEIADTQDPVVFGPDPQIVPVIDIERLDRLGQGIGQRFVNHGTDPYSFIISAQQPVAVGTDPQDILIPVFQQ